jgi:8-amino-7-oxononanoate synthase
MTWSAWSADSARGQTDRFGRRLQHDRHYCGTSTARQVARKYNARILIDDAHATGVIGKGGRGTASYFGLEKEVDMTMGTFSKTFSSLGGFVVGDRAVINYLKHHAPALIFSASPTPAAVAAALAALDIMERAGRMDRLIGMPIKPSRIQSAWFNVQSKLPSSPSSS